jgi:ribonuclease HI
MYVELFAISEALTYVISASLKKVVILSDSKSALQHIAYKILDKVLVLVDGGVVLGLQWIPSHIGVHGNEEADKLARDAISKGTEIYLKQEYTEVLLGYKNGITSQWQEYFDIVTREKGIWFRTMQSEPPRIPWCASV